MESTRNNARLRRKIRIRKKVKGTAERPRLAVFRSGKHIYAQAIDDVAGRTLLAASSLSPEIRDLGEKPGTTAGSMAVGKLIGRKLTETGIVEAVFDRGGYLYHGRVKALADGAREAGITF